MLIAFTPSVGVAPGTTTMTLGKPPGSSELVCLGEPCPPDPLRRYTSPLNVKSGWASGATGPTKSPQQLTVYDLYATESQLRAGSLAGLGGGGARLGVGVVAAAIGFAAVLGYGIWRRRGSLNGLSGSRARSKLKVPADQLNILAYAASYGDASPEDFYAGNRTTARVSKTWAKKDAEFMRRARALEALGLVDMWSATGRAEITDAGRKHIEQAGYVKDKRGIWLKPGARIPSWAL